MVIRDCRSTKLGICDLEQLLPYMLLLLQIEACIRIIRHTSNEGASIYLQQDLCQNGLLL
jgi:hypothetical protein